MANNLILPFGQNASGTDILTDTQYQSDNQRLIGNQPGIARLELVNKALRSDSVLAAALAQFIADNQATDVHDSLSLSTLVGMFKNALDNAGLDAQTLNGQLASYYTNITARLGYTPAHLAGSSTQTFNVANATTDTEALPRGQLMKSLPNSVDLNTVTDAGFYRINQSPVNAPPNTNFWPLLVCYCGSSDTLFQITTDYVGNHFYFRSGNTVNNPTGSWSPWRDLLNGDSSIPYHVANATTNSEAVNLGQFASLIATPGWKQYADPNSPSGKIIEQWGSTSQADDSYVQVTFPVAFPNGVLDAQATATYNGSVTGTNVLGAHIGNITNSSMSVGISMGNGVSGLGARWRVTGY